LSAIAQRRKAFPRALAGLDKLLRVGCGKVQILAAATTQFKHQVAPEQ
jgi:hypothetical protein